MSHALCRLLPNGMDSYNVFFTISEPSSQFDFENEKKIPILVVIFLNVNKLSGSTTIVSEAKNLGSWVFCPKAYLEEQLELRSVHFWNRVMFYP